MKRALLLTNLLMNKAIKAEIVPPARGIPVGFIPHHVFQHQGDQNSKPMSFQG
jgi:hypothetical protein